MNSGTSKKLCRLTAALMLSASCAAIERAEAACNPLTSSASPVNNTTVTCSDSTFNQNDPNGWGTGVEIGNTINVQGTLVGFQHGISIDTGNSVINSLSLSGGVGDGIRAFGSLNVTNSATGIISGGIDGIFTNAFRTGDPATVTVDNSGTIEVGSNGSSAIAVQGNITVNNSGDGKTTGIITGRRAAINANNITVTNNTGNIEATEARAVAIRASGDTNVNNGGGSVLANANGSIAIGASGSLTVRNGTGKIQANGAPDQTLGVTILSFAIEGATVNLNGNDGVIEATGTGGTAILTDSGAATVTNGTGRITGNVSAIESKLINIIGNTGTIEAIGPNGIAVNASQTGGTANVTNSGIIRADNGVAIQAAGTATVNNLSGGNITAGGTAISAISLDITNAQGATISGGANGVSGSGVVRNAGTISGAAASVSFTGTGPNSLALQTGSLLVGDAIGGSGAFNALILEGHGATTSANNFFNFNFLDVQPGANWVWNTSAPIGATIGATALNGTLAIDGVLVSPVTVNSGGALAGRGTVTGPITVNNGGVIAPGAAAPFSTLNVTGGVTFSTGSIYRVNVDAAGNNDKVAISANANLAGTVNVLLQNGFVLGTPVAASAAPPSAVLSAISSFSLRR
jgi:hypothetical protein